MCNHELCEYHLLPQEMHTSTTFVVVLSWALDTEVTDSLAKVSCSGTLQWPKTAFSDLSHCGDSSYHLRTSIPTRPVSDKLRTEGKVPDKPALTHVLFKIALFCQAWYRPVI